MAYKSRGTSPNCNDRGGGLGFPAVQVQLVSSREPVQGGFLGEAKEALMSVKPVFPRISLLVAAGLLRTRGATMIRSGAR